MGLIVDEVRQAAIESLRRCVDPAGLKASGRRVGHHQIWTRDAMIAALGGSFAGDFAIDEALRASLRLLRSAQTPAGLIPNNVDAATLRPNFRAYADAGLWWIIGSTFLERDDATIDRVLRWYECQDVDRSGLLSMQESADWQDLFCTRGKGLYLNCLHAIALRLAGREEAAQAVRDRINEFFWYRGDGNMLRHIRHTFSTESVEEQDSLGRRRWLPRKQLLESECYYLPYLGFRAAGEWFDSLGHALAILAGVADLERAEKIVEFVARQGMAERPMIAMCPQVWPGDPDWRNYYGMLNLPGHYHNGGIWPFIGGFWVAALVKLRQFDEAAATLRRLADLNRCGEFNEWHHGDTGEPRGVADQAWSAGMYLFAYECVRKGRVPLLDNGPDDHVSK